MRAILLKRRIARKSGWNMTKPKSAVATENPHAATKRKRGRPNKVEDVPVSLAPLDPMEALAALLQVSPAPKERPAAEKKTGSKKRARKKR